jgi:hypothetical protein
MKPSQRLALGAIALLVVVVGAWLSTGTPNLTVVNDGIGVTYPWRRGLGALLAGFGCVLLGYAVRRTWVRVGAALLALACTGVGVYQLTYRLDTTARGIAARGLLGGQEIPWREITHVGADPTLLVVQADGNRRIAIDTTDFSPSQRLVLSRTITRRINESTAASQ